MTVKHTFKENLDFQIALNKELSEELNDQNKYIEYLEDMQHQAKVDTEILLDYITCMELERDGKITNGRLPFFDDYLNEVVVINDREDS